MDTGNNNIFNHHPLAIIHLDFHGFHVNIRETIRITGNYLFHFKNITTVFIPGWDSQHQLRSLDAQQSVAVEIIDLLGLKTNRDL